MSTDFAGPVLATLQGQRVILAKRLGSGGQGEVFALVEPDGYVLKRYFEAEIGRDPSLADRLTVMANAMPARTRSAESDHILLAWPTDLVESGDHFIGYLMPLIDRSKTLPLHRVANPSDGRRSSSTSASRWARHIDWSYLVTAAANLALAVQVLHQAGVVIGDFNENNVLVWRDARVTLLDCDSMQITAASGRHYLCRVGRAEFTPPELFRANWGHTVRAPSSDLFALAIHIHQLIMEGEHPFRGVWSGPDEKPTGQDLALEGVWAYGGDPRLRPRPRAVSNEILSPEIQALFARAFVDGAVNPRGATFSAGVEPGPAGPVEEHDHLRDAAAAPLPTGTQGVSVVPPREGPGAPDGVDAVPPAIGAGGGDHAHRSPGPLRPGAEGAGGDHRFTTARFGPPQQPLGGGGGLPGSPGGPDLHRGPDLAAGLRRRRPWSDRVRCPWSRAPVTGGGRKCRHGSPTQPGHHGGLPHGVSPGPGHGDRQ